MSVKECGQVTLVVFFILLLVILIIGAVLQPTKPRFVLLDATVYSFNVSAPNLLTSTFQVTVRSTNPMDHVSIYYDRLIVFASYRDQQVTLPTGIPPTYQDTNGMNIWSPFVSGVKVPIVPFIGEALQQDQTSGYLQVNFKMDGRLRWKVGAFVSGPTTSTWSAPRPSPSGTPTPASLSAITSSSTSSFGAAPSAFDNRYNVI